LYKHLHNDDVGPPPASELDSLWAAILANPMLHYLAADLDGRIVSTCALTIIPNLTRGCRPYGLIENVVTHPDFRRRGLGKAVIRHALGIAWKHGCYKVMLMTGRKQPEVHQFYCSAGFIGGVKTGFIAYPSGHRQE
jgi:GNAT superfamily N-acetyltransferase